MEMRLIEYFYFVEMGYEYYKEAKKNIVVGEDGNLYEIYLSA